MSQFKYTGYSEWDLQGSRRERIGADCIRAYESSGEEQYQKAAARIAELEARELGWIQSLSALELEKRQLAQELAELREALPNYEVRK